MSAVYKKFLHVYLRDIGTSGVPVLDELVDLKSYEAQWEALGWDKQFGPLLLTTPVTLTLEQTTEELVLLKLGALREKLVEVQVKAEAAQKAIKDEIMALSMIGYDAGTVTVLEDSEDDAPF